MSRILQLYGGPQEAYARRGERSKGVLCGEIAESYEANRCQTLLTYDPVNQKSALIKRFEIAL